ncbi:MAG: hypothetical protein FWG87_09025 [Defluviitaleaceae bacterium]|nr:hypothetical protein [Defluviitaleaceae bacterium]
MKTTINLLPPTVRKIQARRKWLVRLVIVQVAALLSLAAVVFVLRHLEQQAVQEAAEFYEALNALGSTPEIMADELRAVQQAALINEQIAEISTHFEREWINGFLAAVPENAELTRVEYRRNEILVAGTADSLDTVERHKLSMAQIFTYVRSGRINRTEGVYFYEIYAGVE